MKIIQSTKTVETCKLHYKVWLQVLYFWWKIQIMHVHVCCNSVVTIPVYCLHQMFWKLAADCTNLCSRFKFVSFSVRNNGLTSIVVADPGFPVGGHGPRMGRRGLPRQLRFEYFVCQNERIWTLGGACAGHLPM